MKKRSCEVCVAQSKRRADACPLRMSNLILAAKLLAFGIFFPLFAAGTPSQSQTSRPRPPGTPGKTESSNLLLRASNRVKERKYQEAEALLKKAVAIDPKNASAFERMGSLYADEERWQEALSSYEEAHTLLPRDTTAKASLAALYEQTGDNEASLKIANSILPETRPTRLLAVMVVDYLALNRPEEAQKFIGQILQNAPANPDLVPQLATIFLRKGLVGDAGELLRIVENHQKVTSAFLVALARVQARTGKPTQSKGTLAKALALDPSNSDALIETARQRGDAGDWKTAAASLQKVWGLGPPRISVLQGLVFASMQTDDLQTAHDAAARTPIHKT